MFVCVKDGEYRLTVKHSEFLAFSYLIENRDDAKRRVAELKAKYSDATHVCYGYIADETGDDFGYDDDGEPSGTAGKPIYSALLAAGVKRSLVAVVRYFGGVKLGTGGLTRAYRESAANLIETFGTVKVERRAEYRVTCGQSEYKRIYPMLRGLGYVSDIVYNDKVTFKLSAATDTDIASRIGPFGATTEFIGEKFISVEEVRQ